MCCTIVHNKTNLPHCYIASRDDALPLSLFTPYRNLPAEGRVRHTTQAICGRCLSPAQPAAPAKNCFIADFACDPYRVPCRPNMRVTRVAIPWSATVR